MNNEVMEKVGRAWRWRGWYLRALVGMIVGWGMVFGAGGAPVIGAGALQFRNYTQENGLPANCVRDIAQDHNGFVWMATDGGLTRFDGYQFKLYELQGSSAVRDDNYASSILIKDDQIWVGTDTHLFRYDHLTDSFFYVPIIDEKGGPLALNVRNMAIDKDENLWLNIMDNGICRIVTKDEAYDVEFFSFPLFKNMISKVFVDSRNDIWATTAQKEGGLYRFDKNQKKFQPFTLTYNGKQFNPKGSAIAEDEEHNMWIGEWDGSIFSFDPFSGEVGSVVPGSESPQLLHVHTITPLAKGMLMIGSDAGLAAYDRRTNKMRLFKQDELDAASLSDQFVYPIISDHEGGLWIGTFYGGVNYLAPNLKNFEKFQPSRYVNSVSGNVVSDFAEDARGNIWIATDDNGLSQYNPSTHTFIHHRLNGNGPENLHSLMVDDNNLWIGSYGQGVFVKDLVSGKVEKINDDKNANSYAMFRDSHKRLWIATGNWLCRYDRDTRKLEPINYLNALIIDIDEDSKGRLWISTQGYGLYRYNPDNGDWRNFRYTGGEDCLPHNHICCVLIDSQKRMWIGSAAGLVRYDEDTETFSLDHRLDPLGTIYGIVEDQNALWLSTEIGLAKYVPDGDLHVFTTTDGISPGTPTNNAMIKASNGKIYFGTSKGFTSFFPYQIKPNEVLPTVTLTGLEINNQEILNGDEHLPQALEHLDRLVLHPDDNSVALIFSALSYVNPHKNQYQYKLEGFDKDWVRAGNNNKAYYTNLPAGNYTFKVRATNSDNLWGENEAVLKIKVLPPWYATWWMQIIYLLLIIGLVVGVVYRLMQRSNQKHKTEMMRLSNEKEIEVYQSKLSFFTIIAHEIRTPVSLIIGPLENLVKHQDKLPHTAYKDLMTIEKNGQRLLFLVNQLLDFKKVEEAITVRFRRSNITDLVHGVTDRFGPSMEGKGIKLEVHCEVPADFMADVDYELVTKLVSNLLNNARKFTKDHVTCTLWADEAHDRFSISVCDNGIGVSKKEQEKIFRPFYQVRAENQDSKGGTGLGLSIVQNVVEAHGGSIAIDSDLGKGTCFTATFPIHQAEVEDELPENRDVKPEEEVVVTPTDRKVKMLVVDDNEELCNFIANSFNEQYDVITAEDGEDAMRLLRKNPDVAVIISDWMMPKKDGVELCREVHEDMNYSHIPFVLLTARTDNTSKIEGLNCGADSFIEKPFSVQVLQARIENLLRTREMLRKKYSNTPLEPIETIATHTVDNEFLTRLTDIIEENFANPELDIDFLAAKMDMSRSSLYSKIRGLVDVTPNDLIRITRLKNAAKLLAEGHYRINEVCYMVGFNSPSYFAKCFQKQFGVSPSDFVQNPNINTNK